MNLKIEIRRNYDGVTACEVWPNWEFGEYWWKEGNAACDCNRESFFTRAQGSCTDGCEYECGHGRYSVRCLDADSGTILYEEFADPLAT
jgi:hypothetical protein